MKTEQLAVEQLDTQLAKWKNARLWFQPKNGWIKTIRKTLGITTNQLAKKLNVDRSRIIRIEVDETRAALTMKTLTTVANALNCDFVYAFVPREPLHKIIEQQANKIAMEQLKNISHNMFLENQVLPLTQNKKQLKELKAKLIEKMPKSLWDNND